MWRAPHIDEIGLFWYNSYWIQRQTGSSICRRLSETRYATSLVSSTVNNKEPPVRFFTSFISGFRRTMFTRTVDHEIFERIFPHLEHEKCFGYDFRTDEQLEALIESMDIRDQLLKLELQIHRMPKAYGKALRYVLFRDLHKRLCLYEEVARQHVRPDWC